MILGPRRVGKTTVLYQTVRRLLDAAVEPSRVWWLRLDHPLLLQVNLDALVREVLGVSGATIERPVYLMLDEIVYAKDWNLWLKTFHDDRWPVRIAATSSATAALRDRRLESGVGRWAEHYLNPYLFPEFLALNGQGREAPVGETLAETHRALPAGRHGEQALEGWRLLFMLVGGFPELLASIVLDEEAEKPDLKSRLLSAIQAISACSSRTSLLHLCGRSRFSRAVDCITGVTRTMKWIWSWITPRNRWPSRSPHPPTTVARDSEP